MRRLVFWLGGLLAAAARIAAVPLLAVAVIALVTDGTRILNGAGVAFASANEHWATIAPQSLAAARGAVQKSLHPMVWDAGVRRVLAMPSFALFGLAGGLLAYAGRRRRRTNVFVN